MKLYLVDQNGSEYVYNFEKDSIIIGRGENCDVIIQSDHVSRKHLEVIHLNQKFYIKDLTLSNWVSYNDEKLVKNTQIQYYDFAPLVLPGGFSLKIEDEKNIINESSLEHTITNSINRKSGETTIRLTNQLKKERVSKSKKGKERSNRRKDRKRTQAKDMRTIFYGFIVIALLGLAYYFSQVPEVPLPTPKKRPSKASEIKKIKKVKKVITADKPKKPKPINPWLKKYKAYMDIKNTCPNAAFSDICKRILGDSTPLEKVIIENQNLIVIIGHNRSIKRKVGDDLVEYKKLLSYPKSSTFMALESVLKRDLLEKLERMGFMKIAIYMFHRVGVKVSLKDVFLFDPTHYRRVSMNEWERAKKQFFEYGSISLFNRNFSDLLEKVF